MSDPIWQSLGVNQRTDSGTSYPFANPGDDVRYILGDLWLAYDNDACGYVLPLKVKWMYGFGSTSVSNPLSYTARHAKDMVIVDANDVVVFNTTLVSVQFLATAWGNNLETLQWTDGDTILRATRHISPPPWDPGHIRHVFIVPTNGELDARTYMQLPKRVKSVRVGLTKISVGNLVLSEGYNAHLVSEPQPRNDGGRLVNRVRIRFKPGDGLGRIPGCADVEPVLRRINTVQPTEGGDFLVDTSGCYWLRRPSEISHDHIHPNPSHIKSAREATLGGSDFGTRLDATIAAVPAAYIAGADSGAKAATRAVYTAHHTTLAKSALQVLNDCGPCCTCDEFLHAYEGIRRLDDKYRTIGIDAEHARDVFLSNIARWESQRQCRAFQSLRLSLQPERHCGLFVGALHCNNVECCTQQLVLRTTFEGFSGGSPVSLAGSFQVKCHENKRSGADTKYDEIDYTPITNWPVMDHPFDFADPQGTSSIRTRLKFNGCPADVVRVTLSVHAVSAVDKRSGKVCHLPDPSSVTIPSSVAAIWATHPPLHPVRALITKTVPVSETSGCGVCP